LRRDEGRLTRQLAAMAAGTIIAVSASALPPVTERPAVMSHAADRSNLVALTRAGDRLIAVGERGYILLSDDNGRSWRQATVPVSVTLTAARFVDARTGWAVGHSGIVLHSADGGESWSRQLDGTRAADAVLRYFTDKSSPEWKAGGNRQEQLAAARQLVDDGPDKPFLDLYFKDSLHGIVVGAYNLIFATDDGGKTWTPAQDRIDNPRGLHLYAIQPVQGCLYIAGEQGSLWRSTDGGGSFVAVPTSYRGSWFGMVGLRDGGLLLFGLRGNAYRSVEHGAAWQPVAVGTRASLTSGLRLGGDTLMLTTQAGEVLASRDSGLSFNPLALKTGWPFSGIASAADGAVIVVGERGVMRIDGPSSVEARRQEHAK